MPDWLLVVWAVICLLWASLGYLWRRTALKWGRLAERWESVASDWREIAASNRAIAETSDRLVGRMEEELVRRETVIAQLMQESRVDGPRCPRNHGDGTQCVRTVGHRGQHLDNNWLRWP